MGNYLDDFDDIRQMQQEDDYHAEMAFEAQKQWLKEQLTEQTTDAISSSVKQAYGNISS